MGWLKRSVSIILVFSAFVEPSFAIGFSKIEIQLGKQTLEVELADTDEKRARGLMERKKLEGDGMLFVYPKAQALSFWMKNTLLDLSIGFFDEQGTLFEVLDMDAESSLVLESKLKVYRSRKPARYALEMLKGSFLKRNIPLGAKLKIITKN